MLRWHVALALAVSLSVSACASSPIPRPGGRVIHGGATITTLQPILDTTDRLATDLIYAQLTRPDPRTGAPLPYLASWRLDPDGLTYRWTMDPGATWSDGRPIVAEDWLTGVKAVALSLRTSYKSFLTEIAGFGAYAEGKVETIGGIAIDPADPRRWTVTYARAFCAALSRNAVGFVLPTHVFGKYLGTRDGAIDRAPENDAPPVASGPFLFGEWRRGEQLTLRSNPRYHLGAPLLDEYVLREGTQAATSLAQLRAGELDVGLVAAGDVEAVASDADLAHRPIDGLSYFYVGWNLRQPRLPALGDRRVRQALAYAVDVDTYVSTVLRGQVTRIHAHHTPASWAYSRPPIEYGFDPARAATLLRAAGFARGADGVYERGTERLAFTLTGTAGMSALMQVLRDQYRQFGVDVALRTMTLAALQERLQVAPNEFDAWALAWNIRGTDPDPYAIFGREEIPDPATGRRGFNYGGYSDPAAERAMLDARAPADRDCSVATRARRYEAFARQVNEDQPYLFLYTVRMQWVARSRLQGFDPAPFSTHWNVERWWLAR